MILRLPTTLCDAEGRKPLSGRPSSHDRGSSRHTDCSSATLLGILPVFLATLLPFGRLPQYKRRFVGSAYLHGPCVSTFSLNLRAIASRSLFHSSPIRAASTRSSESKDVRALCFRLLLSLPLAVGCSSANPDAGIPPQGSTAKSPRWARAFKYEPERAETRIWKITVQGQGRS